MTICVYISKLVQRPFEKEGCTENIKKTMSQPKEKYCTEKVAFTFRSCLCQSISLRGTESNPPAPSRVNSANMAGGTTTFPAHSSFPEPHKLLSMKSLLKIKKKNQTNQIGIMEIITDLYMQRERERGGRVDLGGEGQLLEDIEEDRERGVKC